MKTKGLKKRMAMILILLAGWHMTARPEVIITGILHGTLTGGSPKAVELFITGTENLDNYEIWRSLNGAPFGSGSGSISSMSGVYTNTFVYLVKTDHVNAFHDVFGTEGIFANVLPMGIISSNGNDGFQVRLKVGSVVVDQVWLEDPTDSYRDSYWYRKHGTGPDGGWLPSAWETPGNDALDGLDEAGLRAAVPFGTYAVMWQGLTANWNNDGNWSTGITPSFQTNVLVPDTVVNFPVIDNLPENPAICMNLTIADTARLIVNAGRALTVSGNLILDTLSSGESERGLILKSDSTSSPAGSLLISGNPSGTVILERYIAKDNGWHFLSSPVQEQLFQPGFVPDPIDESFDLYYWEENASPTVGWINIRGDDGQWNPQFGDAFIPGKGYLVAYSAANDGEESRMFSGLLNSGNQDFQLFHSVNYWNLLGNPYSCALDWSSAGIDKTAVAANTMYIWDPALNENLGGYRAHNGTTGVPAGTTPIIPAMQGYFVQSLEESYLSIDISNDEPLLHSGQPFYKSGKDSSVEQIRLNISKNQWSDETLICFDPAATNQFDPGFDAEKLFNGHAVCPEIYSLADDHQLCINILAGDPASIPLGVSYGQQDTLILTAFDFDGIPKETGIFLEDNLQSTWLDMREQTEYRFNHNPFLPVSRFTLHFMSVARVCEHDVKDNINLWCFENRIYLSNPKNIEGDLYLYSIEGRSQERFVITGGNQVFPLSESPGLYIIRFVSPQINIGRKIFIY